MCLPQNTFLFRIRGINGIQSHAVCGHRIGNILCAFHPAFNFEAGYPGLTEFGQDIHSAEIIHGKQVTTICFSFSFALSRFAGWLPGVLTAAGLNALTAQTGLASMQTGKHAKSGIAETHGTMDKHLDFSLGFAMNDRHLLNGQLTSQHYPLKAKISQLFCCQRIMRRHQGGGMEGKFGEPGAGKIEQTEILNNQGIGP